jgi:hypothetical protein
MLAALDRAEKTLELPEETDHVNGISMILRTTTRDRGLLCKTPAGGRHIRISKPRLLHLSWDTRCAYCGVNAVELASISYLELA